MPRVEGLTFTKNPDYKFESSYSFYTLDDITDMYNDLMEKLEERKDRIDWVLTAGW